VKSKLKLGGCFSRFLQKIMCWGKPHYPGEMCWARLKFFGAKLTLGVSMFTKDYVGTQNVHLRDGNPRGVLWGGTQN